MTRSWALGMAAALVLLITGCTGDSGPSVTQDPSVPEPSRALLSLASGSVLEITDHTTTFLSDITRLAHGQSLRAAQWRLSAYPSGVLVVPPHARSLRSHGTVARGCPQLSLAETPASAMTLDYGSGCIDAFDGVMRAGKVLVHVGPLAREVDDSDDFGQVVATVEFENYQIDAEVYTGDVVLDVKSSTEVHWDVDVMATRVEETRSLQVQAMVRAMDDYDIETVRGNAQLLSSKSGLVEMVLGDLEFDVVAGHTLLACDDPIGGTLTLKGQNTAVSYFSLEESGCGFAAAAVDGAVSMPVHLDGGLVDADVAVEVVGAQAHASEHTIVVDESDHYYNIILTNTGLDTAQEVVLTSTFSGTAVSLDFISSTGDCVIQGAQVICHIKQIHPDEFVHLIVYAIPAEAGTLSYEVHVSALADTDPSNDAGTVVVTVDEKPEED